MRENNRLPRSPVFVVNRGAIFDCNRTHVIFSLSLLGDVEDGPPSTGLNVSLGSRSANCLLAANQPSLRSVLRSPRRGNKTDDSSANRKLWATTRSVLISQLTFHL